ncbi:LytTR family DNA-binding domain-containing protein [Arcticibacterium luteifluviistationis]|uniref:HTH LytTR-type domain-containing protein n=1 Tax=Arcticibacterium luteifluviistationis TaxID=1784714 RepID=A0A2Z4G8W2_9BACT|nr:LytTR family DNA-binding domain-containing protein [Arcticibacterium luteifluviistationis]AWV97545.1 hypothetical protein DJ013_04940 [Arcticibacterium luteifluviistationis]
MKRIDYPDESEIIYLKGVVNYTEFHLKNGRKQVSSSTLRKHHENHSHFLRVSKSHVLNPKYIKRIDSSGSCIVVELKTGNKVQVSRRRQEVLNSYLT